MWQNCIWFSLPQTDYFYLLFERLSDSSFSQAFHSQFLSPSPDACWSQTIILHINPNSNCFIPTNSIRTVPAGKLREDQLVKKFPPPFCSPITVFTRVHNWSLSWIKTNAAHPLLPYILSRSMRDYRRHLDWRIDLLTAYRSGTRLQAGRLRKFFSIYIILPVALWPCGRLSL
jgi:hypothetical protein